jgi:mono/diheme cytochrome c family protein
MHPNCLRVAAWLIVACLACRVGIAADRDGDFERSVARVLIRNCIGCHNATNPKGKLDLTSRESLLKGGESGPAIVPGNTAKSYLIERVADGSMPPKKNGQRLPQAVVAGLKRWVIDGANWPKGRRLSSFELTTPKRAGFDWWSFQPVKRPAIPAVRDRQWLRNPIDAFVLNRLERARLSPASNADRLTLFRRLKFDLIGLPPTPREIDDFLADRSPAAYERAVDRFLASPHYGERWGRHWLDVVRFGESDGFEHDKLRPHAWPYRDYVIRSFNENKPYDRFVAEQLAGDVLQPVTPEGIAATGFFVAGPWDEVQNVAASQIERRRAREEEMEELITAVSQSFLGVTVNCARCHDHKFDPVSQADYYRIKSVFAGVSHADGRKPGLRSILTPTQRKIREARLTPLRQRISALTAQLAKLDSHIASDAVADKTLKNALVTGRFGKSLNARATGFTARSKADFQSSPLTVECWARAKSSLGFNVFVANNLKSSGGHWELYSFSGTGDFSAYLPGLSPATVRSGVVITDDKWHYLGMQFDGKRVRLFVDGKQVKDQPVKRVKPVGPAVSLYFGGYAPDGIGCDGSVDEVRISRGIRPIAGLPHAPFPTDDRTLGLWHFDAIRGGRVTDAANTRRQIDRKQLDQQRAALLVEKVKLEKQIASMAEPMAYIGHRRKPPTTHVLIRGNPEQPGAAVTPGGLSGIRHLSPDLRLKPGDADAARRIKFAQWVTHPRNPLTARVIVNRLWQYHFGQGLVKTPSDFGFNGGPPSHPQLLDWLADELVNSGWDLKRMQRLILTSATFRQSSQFQANDANVDSTNRLLWRFSPRRLEGEIIRDAMLAVSGELNSKLGGPSFRPFTVTVFNTHFYHMFDSDKPDFNRRTVYRIQVSTGRSAFLDALGCPSPSLASPKRRTTTTPLQALALMNNTFAVRQAERFADRVRRRAGERINAQVTLAIRTAYGRLPTKSEISKATEFVRRNGLKSLCRVLLNSSEFLYVR